MVLEIGHNWEALIYKHGYSILLIKISYIFNIANIPTRKKNLFVLIVYGHGLFKGSGARTHVYGKDSAHVGKGKA